MAMILSRLRTTISFMFENASVDGAGPFILRTDFAKLLEKPAQAASVVRTSPSFPKSGPLVVTMLADISSQFRRAGSASDP